MKNFLPVFTVLACFVINQQSALSADSPTATKPSFNKTVTVMPDGKSDKKVDLEIKFYPPKKKGEPGYEEGAAGYYEVTLNPHGVDLFHRKGSAKTIKITGEIDQDKVNEAFQKSKSFKKFKEAAKALSCIMNDGDNPSCEEARKLIGSAQAESEKQVDIPELQQALGSDSIPPEHKPFINKLKRQGMTTDQAIAKHAENNEEFKAYLDTQAGTKGRLQAAKDQAEQNVAEAETQLDQTLLTNKATVAKFDHNKVKCCPDGFDRKAKEKKCKNAQAGGLNKLALMFDSADTSSHEGAEKLGCVDGTEFLHRENVECFYMGSGYEIPFTSTVACVSSNYRKVETVTACAQQALATRDGKFNITKALEGDSGITSPSSVQKAE